MQKYYLAIDIGASSGRHIVGWEDAGEVKTKEVYRFPNKAELENGHLIWNMERMLLEVKQGIRMAKEEFGTLESLSIDTWGVDYVLLQEDREVFPCYSYRDGRTEAAVLNVHKQLPFKELYRHTGCQFQQFNTVYQLYADKLAGRLDGVTDFLMVPEYLLWKLCGVKAKEYTNATTTGMVSAETGEFDTEIIQRLGLPAHLFPKLSQPGTVLGTYEGIKVLLCATHDTASAVEAIAVGNGQPYISSGTWSLLGVRTQKPFTDPDSCAANYSNEGGVGYNRYQKNIMGLWLVQELRRELCPNKDFTEIVDEAEKSSYDGVIDANAPEFLSPPSMRAAFDTALAPRLPQGEADYFRCAYRSLAFSYRVALAELERNTGKHYTKIYIVGGGAKNKFLNRLTEEVTGRRVAALPIEATALGNLKVQMKAEMEEK